MEWIVYLLSMQKPHVNAPFAVFIVNNSVYSYSSNCKELNNYYFYTICRVSQPNSGQRRQTINKHITSCYSTCHVSFWFIVSSEFPFYFWKEIIMEKSVSHLIKLK